MGKIALWIVVIIVVMLLVRALKPRRGNDAGAADKRAAGGSVGGADRAAEADGSRGGELMMSCAVCGVHLPASDAVFAGGRVYCGPEHRDIDLDRQPRDRDAAARGDGE